MAYRQNDSQRRNDVVRYDLKERIGVLSKRDNGWTREVNIMSWNNGIAKVDIREWDPEHNRMTKGVTLFEEEAETLTRLLARRYGLRLDEGEPVQRTFVKGESGPVNREFMNDERARDYSKEERSPGAETAGASAAEAAAAPTAETVAAPAMETAAAHFGQTAESAACVAESSPLPG